jgi:MFS transporter, ACS family, D-galactonate transporter
VEARNPALIATGLAIWGLIIRIVVFAAYLFLPLVINSVTPLVNYGATVSAYATQYKSEIAFATTHPQVVAAAQKVPAPVIATAQKIPPNITATAQKIPPDVLAIAQKDGTQLANAQKFAPELAVIQAHPALFTKLATYSNPAKIPGPLLAQAIAAAGGGAKGVAMLTSISQNKAAINGVIAVAPDLQKVAPYAADLKTIAPYSAQLNTIAPYSAQLTAASKIPPNVSAYLKAHAADVQSAAAKTAGQWKTWYWICFGGIIFFLLSIPLLRGRWRTRDAKRDEAEHEAKVQEELAKLQASV